MWLDWPAFCDCGFSLPALWGPLSAPTILLGFLLPWTWDISSWLLQQSTAAAPYLEHGVAPLGYSYAVQPPKQRHYFANKGPYSQSHRFSSSQVWMWKLYHKEGWVLKNWCFWTVVLEKIEKKIYFNWGLITLQYCSGFCHTLTWISHGCTYVPHPEPPFHLPPHTIPLGHPSASAQSTLSHGLNLDWRSISHMVIYMFQCYFLKSSHPHLLPQSPKVCFGICVSFAVSRIGLLLPSL